MTKDGEEDDSEAASLDLFEWMHSDLRDLIHQQAEAIYDKLHLIAHGCYFIAVFFEGHGFYALTAGGLFCILCWGFWAGYGDD